MNYRNLTKKEYDKTIIELIEELDKPLLVAGKHRKKDWIKGWSDSQLYPKYYGKHKVNRLNGKLVMALSKNYEREALYTLLRFVFKKYLSKVDSIYDFGCGTGHILRIAREVNPSAYLHGFDWANKDFQYYDFFEPRKFFISPKGGIYTVAALEQTGTKFRNFVKQIIKSKPGIVVHVEPIEELLDPTNLLDYLSLRYFKKRGYLSGYLTYLRELEKKGKIKIHEARRSGIGSKFIEGYSIIAWSPL